MSYRRHYMKDGQIVFLDGDKSSRRSVVAGAIGLTKAALRIDRAHADTIDTRHAICAACEHSHGVVNRCDLCGCFISAKITIRGETCPDGKW